MFIFKTIHENKNKTAHVTVSPFILPSISGLVLLGSRLTPYNSKAIAPATASAFTKNPRD